MTTPRVIVGLPEWNLNGVCVFSANLVRGLSARGVDARLFITEEHTPLVDYPRVGPEHAFLKDAGRAEYVGVTDDDAMAAFHLLARTEGILAALESSHAVAQGIKLARDLPKDQLVLVNLSGRGDKDVHTIARREGLSLV